MTIDYDFEFQPGDPVWVLVLTPTGWAVQPGCVIMAGIEAAGPSYRVQVVDRVWQCEPALVFASRVKAKAVAKARNA